MTSRSSRFIARRKPTRYTFTLCDRSALIAFVQRQKVPPHDHPRRRIRLERWIIGQYLLAVEGAGRVDFPIRLAHALGNQSPDFIVRRGLNPPEGQEVTQATTRKYQVKLERNERLRSRGCFALGTLEGVAGHQAETYWCRRILKAVRDKLAKLCRYEAAATQHLLIYDDMDTKVGVNHRDAVRRLRPRLLKVLATAPIRFVTVSIVSTQNRVLYDVSGTGDLMRVP